MAGPAVLIITPPAGKPSVSHGDQAVTANIPLISVQETGNRKKQESCAIAKMTAQCTLYMGALKIFGTL